MARTLIFLATHFVDEAIISEYRKMKNTPNVDAVLAIDNTNFKCEFKSRVENKIFLGTSTRCFFFDSALHEEMNLPYFTFKGVKDFGGNMWHNGDYRFYYVRKFFPNYDYYWLIEYDVFCNAPTYEGFLKKFTDNRADLLVTGFRAEKKNGEWSWTYGLDWVYSDCEIYGSFFPVIRLSARAIDFLYQRRLEHVPIFEQATGDKRWIFCELFVTTELMNAGFSCENIDEPHVGLKLFYLNDDRFFTAPDNQLYHPVKSARKEIDKLKQQHTDALRLYRKVFLSQLVEKVAALKNFPAHIDNKFNFVIFAIPKRGGAADFNLRYEVRFLPEGIIVALVFDGNYANDLSVINKFTGLASQPPALYSIATSKALGYVVKLDDLQTAASALQFLIGNTYPVLENKYSAPPPELKK